MISKGIKTTLAYRCPSCGGVPTSAINVFSISGDLFRFKCSCGGSEMTIERTQDKKYRLTYPCLLCPRPHTQVLSRNLVFGEDIFMIPCATCGIDLVFFGEENKVSEAIQKSNEEIALSLGKSKLDDLVAEQKETFYDPQILDIVTFVINDLSEDGRVYCNCKNGEGDYSCQIFDDHLTVSCSCCGAKLEVGLTSTIEAYDFLHSEELRLK